MHPKHQDLRPSVRVFSSLVQIKHSLSLLLSLFLSLSLIKFIFNSTLKKINTLLHATLMPGAARGKFLQLNYMT